MSDFLLMMKNTVVMRINFDEGIFDIKEPNLMPFDLRDRFVPMPEEPDYSDKESVKRYMTLSTRASRKNQELITNFLSHRILPLTRKNAKEIYQLFNFDQLQDEISKAKIALICRAVSLQDNFWIKNESDPVRWEDVNLRTNHLNEIVTQVALHGSSLSLTGTDDFQTPELTGLGAYAKAWIREKDGLYLHKLSNYVETEDGLKPGKRESKIEVMCSNLLDCCNVDHLPYEASSVTNPRTKESYYTCKCPCMTTEDISMLSGMDFTTYCNTHGLNPIVEALNIDADSIYKMAIVDYLFSNRDRHDLNWGFYYDCNTGVILGCHPLYDHNNCFDTECMMDKDRPYLYNSSVTMKQAALNAMKHVDFHFIKPITKDMFITERMYESFKDRAHDLGLDLTKVTPDKDIDDLDLE